MELKKHFEHCLRQSLDEKFEGLKTQPAQLLKEAMAYVLLGEGKRIRPLMLLETAYQIWPDSRAYRLAMPAALAVEYVHAYSLIHDDLPCMDDDDYRRGKPSLHRRFNEAVAVLTGDALLSDAFELVAGARNNPARQCQVLSRAIGSRGMVLGQLDDLVSPRKTLQTLQNKTGKLFECACLLGAIAVGASKLQEEESAKRGALFGLEFQLADDVLDGESCVF
ncbi:MAG: polyprenyl synthetase family protein [Myxococcaceae bacterium]